MTTPQRVRVLWLASARAVLRLTWARTMSPLLMLGAFALVLLPTLFSLVFASRGAIAGDPVVFLVQRYDQLVGAIAVPVIALLLGTGAFAAEADDGTLMYIVTTTTPRWWIVLVRMVFASLVTALLSSLAVWCAGYVATGAQDPQHVRGAFMIAAICGATTYASLFTVLALVMRRSLVAGLGYVLFWEGVLTTTFPGINYLSIRQWMLAIAARYTDATLPRSATGPDATVAFVGGGIVVVFALLIATQRLARPRLSRVGT